MTNLEFYKEEIKKRYINYLNQPNRMFTENLMMAMDDVYREFGLSSIDILDWLCEEHQILDKKEKEYLSAVIKPFRKRIKYITKHRSNITLPNNAFILIFLKDVETISLPLFKSETMYKGMEPNKKYTLKELGL